MGRNDNPTPVRFRCLFAFIVVGRAGFAGGGESFVRHCALS
jgi:hypothetical protein